MEQVKGWWFYAVDQEIVIGETYRVEGKVIPFENGFLLSENLMEALFSAVGPVVYQVVGSGVITTIPHRYPVDKHACSECTYVSGGIDISDILWLFARECALSVINSWDAPDIVIQYLKTGDESIREYAGDIALEYADYNDLDAAWSAYAATRANWKVWNVAGSAAAAALDTTLGTTHDTVYEKFNERLTSMVTSAIKSGGKGGDSY